MTVYDAAKKEAVVFDYRETGPAALTPDTYDADHGKATVGGLAVGVPGEIRGLREAWGQHGQLPWRRLIQPSIDLARKGTAITQHMANSMASSSTKARIQIDPGLKELLVNSDGSMKGAGDIIKNEKYAKTLEIIRDDPEDLYVGNLSISYVNDVRAQGGVMTRDDLKGYKPKIKTPLKFNFADLDFYTTPLPGGGTVFAHILKMIKASSFSPSDLNTMDSTILTYHRMVEIFKFSYAFRPRLGDPDVATEPANLTAAFNDAISQATADAQRARINDSSTQELPYYSDYFVKHESEGTTHVSVMDERGNAVAATDTINYGFGAKFRSLDTGIIYNNELADFFHNGTYKGYPVPVANRPAAGKRPLSSTCPSIAVDGDGNARMVIGASGGTRITLSAAWVVAMTKIIGVELGQATNLPRPQHALFPAYIRNEKLMPMSAELIAGLKAKNHDVRNSGLSAIVQTIYKDDSGKLHAKSDPRKHGVPAGY